MKLNKELVDEVIRLNKEYYRTGDTDIFPALNEVENELGQECKETRYVVGLIADIAKFTQHSGVGTYEDIYKALAIFGVIVE